MHCATWSSAERVLPPRLDRELTEQGLIRAYLALFLVAAGDDGAKIVSLARFGAYEVRLIEFAEGLCPHVPPVWMELYAHHARCSLDSCGRSALEDAVIAADAFIARAKALYRHELCRSGAPDRRESAGLGATNRYV